MPGLATASQIIVSVANWSKVRPHNSKGAGGIHDRIGAGIPKRGQISNQLCYL
jgi:hypothetical protein